jgi:hypothetical protein
MKSAFRQTIQLHSTAALLLAGLLSASGVRANEGEGAKTASPCGPETHNVYTHPRGGHPGKSLRLVRVSKVTRDGCERRAGAPDAHDISREATVGGREGG